MENTGCVRRRRSTAVRPHRLGVSGYLGRNPFPRNGWLGLAAAILAPGAPSRKAADLDCYRRSIRSLPFLLKAGSSAVGVASNQTNLAPGRRFEGADELIASDAVQRIVSDSRAAVTVLPETAISRWTEATEAFWEPTLMELHRQHRLAVIGPAWPSPTRRPTKMQR